MSKSQNLAALFKKITHGVYVIGVAAEEKVNAFTAAWVMQVSFTPLLVALSINPRHGSYRLLKKGGGFTVNVLRRDQLLLAKNFGAPAGVDKLAGVRWRAGRKGAPILTDALAYFDCELVADYPAGDHHLAIGRVMEGGVLDSATQPMNYLDTGNMDGAETIYGNLTLPGE